MVGLHVFFTTSLLVGGLVVCFSICWEEIIIPTDERSYIFFGGLDDPHQPVDTVEMSDHTGYCIFNDDNYAIFSGYQMTSISYCYYGSNPSMIAHI